MADASRPYKRYLQEAAADQVFELTNGQVEREALERHLWEAVEAAVDVEPADQTVDPHEIIGDEADPESVKFSNIDVSVEELGGSFARGAVAIGSAVAMPILAPFAMVAVLYEIREVASHDLATEDAVVYSAIFQYADDDEGLAESELLARSADIEAELDFRVSLDQSRIETAIDRLHRIDAITIETKDGTEHYHPNERCLVEWDV